MPRTEARTKTTIWTDPSWRQLTLGAQHLYHLLYSQPNISLCGVIPLTPTRWAAVTRGRTPEDVMTDLGELAEANFVVLDHEYDEVLVRSFVRHDGVARSPKTAAAARVQVDAIASPLLREMAATILEEAIGDAERAKAEARGEPPEARRAPQRPARPTPQPAPQPASGQATLRLVAEEAPQIAKEQVGTLSASTPIGYPEDGTGVRDTPSRSARAASASNSSSNSTSTSNTKDSPSGTSEPAGYADWYDGYPHKVKRADGAKAWKLAVASTPQAVIAAGTALWVAHWTRTGTEQRFVPYPATFLRAQQFLDTPPAGSTPAGGRPTPAENLGNLQAIVERAEKAQHVTPTLYGQTP